MEKTSKIFVVGHKGLVGSAIVRKLEQEEYIIVRNSNELDLTNQSKVNDFFEKKI